MKSKVKIDLDEENNPVIVIEFVDSEDLRDKVVGRFIQSFGIEGNVCLARWLDPMPYNSNNPQPLMIKPFKHWIYRAEDKVFEKNKKVVEFEETVKEFNFQQNKTSE